MSLGGGVGGAAALPAPRAACYKEIVSRAAARAAAELSKSRRHAMDYAELSKTTVSKLREMVKEQLPEAKGVAGLRKGELVELLAKKWGLQPSRVEAAGLGKGDLKAEIRKVKEVRRAAVEARDQASMKATREQLHRLRRQLKKAARAKT